MIIRTTSAQIEIISTRSYFFWYIYRESGVPKFLFGTNFYNDRKCQKGILALRIKYRKIYERGYLYEYSAML